jgi:gliding motility-associated transport system permease protein
LSAVRVIALREFASLFRLPVGWVVMALYLLLTGLVFAMMVLRPGEAATLRSFFGWANWLLLPIAPAVSMRLFSEEYRSGTAETLMTAPVTDAAVVAGKFLGGILFLLAMIAPTLIYVVILLRVSSPMPDPGPMAAGYLSLMLVASLYLSIGLFASALTSNQTLAFIGTLLGLLIVMLVTTVSFSGLPAWVQGALESVSIAARVGDFAKGVIDTGNVVFFVAASGWFLVLTYVAIGSRRWR